MIDLFYSASLTKMIEAQMLTPEQSEEATKMLRWVFTAFDEGYGENYDEMSRRMGDFVKWSWDVLKRNPRDVFNSVKENLKPLLGSRN